MDIRFYDIIYKLVDDIKNAIAGLLALVQKEVYLGQAEIRQIFHLPKIGNIAGSYVMDGKITRNAGVRLLRDGVVVYTGKIASLSATRMMQGSCERQRMWHWPGKLQRHPRKATS